MKNLIQVNPKSFIMGMIFGGFAILTVAADGHHPLVCDYQVVEEAVNYNNAAAYTDAIALSATNGWEFVSAQIIPNAHGDMFAGAKVMIIQKKPKR